MRSIASIAAMALAMLLVGGVSFSWAESMEESAAFLGEIPKGVPTYAIQMGKESIFGAIEIGKQFTDTNGFEALGKMGQLTVIRDTPWAPDRNTTTKPEIELGPRESFRARQDRLSDGWKASPYEIVESADGWRQIPKLERELADRAQAEADKVYDKLYPPVPEEAATAPPLEPGFLAQYGRHIAVLVAALLSLAVVLKGMVFR